MHTKPMQAKYIMRMGPDGESAVYYPDGRKVPSAREGRGKMSKQERIAELERRVAELNGEDPGATVENERAEPAFMPTVAAHEREAPEEGETVEDRKGRAYLKPTPYWQES